MSFAIRPPYKNASFNNLHITGLNFPMNNYKVDPIFPKFIKDFSEPDILSVRKFFSYSKSGTRLIINILTIEGELENIKIDIINKTDGNLSIKKLDIFAPGNTIINQAITPEDDLLILSDNIIVEIVVTTTHKVEIEIIRKIKKKVLPKKALLEKALPEKNISEEYIFINQPENMPFPGSISEPPHISKK